MSSPAYLKMRTAPAIRKDFLAFGKPDFGQGEIDAVTRVLRSGWIGMGAEVIAFEKELAATLRGATVVTVNSCTSALFLALLASGVKAGDEVITPSLTWCATANASIYLGARPTFCDVDPQTLCVTPESVLRRLTPRTRAVVVVHYGGLAIDVASLRAVLPNNVAIVEDAAHAWGGAYPDGSPVGSSGNLTCFSFYANKNLSTAEGGAIALFDQDTAERLRCLRQNALFSDAWNVPGIAELGYKMNYTDLQASIGRIQLARQPQFVANRKAVATRYAEGLRGVQTLVQPQKGLSDDRHARHLYVVTLDTARLGKTRTDIMVELRNRNVGASVHYRPLHIQPFYRAMDPVRLETTEQAGERILTLPIAGSMSVADADYAIGHLLEVIGA